MRTAIALLLLVSASAGAQERSERSGVPFYALLGAGLAANYGFGDRDPGGYVDAPFTMDKQLHFSVAFGLTTSCALARIRPWKCAVATGAAAVAWEYSQRGYVSTLDIGAGILGAGAGMLLERLVR